MNRMENWRDEWTGGRLGRCRSSMVEGKEMGGQGAVLDTGSFQVYLCIGFYPVDDQNGQDHLHLGAIRIFLALS